jgi:hypothetical protein
VAVFAPWLRFPVSQSGSLTQLAPNFVASGGKSAKLFLKPVDLLHRRPLYSTNATIVFLIPGIAK